MTSELSLRLKKFFGFTLMIIVERAEDKNKDTNSLVFTMASITVGNHALGKVK